MARLRQAGLGVLFGFGCLLAACSAAAETPALPVQHVQIGCFRAMDVTVVADPLPVTQRKAEETAQAFYEGQNGTSLPRYIDSTGRTQLAPPVSVQQVRVRASDYGSSGQGGAGGGDPLQGRTVWILGYTAEHTASWSTYREGMSIYIIIDGQTPVPILTCS
jgi:hypothetical protein